MNESAWKKGLRINVPYRRYAFALMGCITGAVYVALRRRGGDEEALLVPMGVLGSMWCAAVIADTVYHAWKGRGHACMHCGHRRPMASFRIHPPCPQCGK
jgi:hypothetical protein